MLQRLHSQHVDEHVSESGQACEDVGIFISLKLMLFVKERDVLTLAARWTLNRFLMLKNVIISLKNNQILFLH